MRRTFQENAEINRRDALSLVSASALGLLLSGCGGGGGGTNSSSSVVVLQDQTRVLPADGTVSISNLSETGLVLSGAKVPAITSGNIIVSTIGSGILRKVDSVTIVDGRYILTTKPAKIEDAFKELKTDQVIGINLPVEGYTTLYPGVGHPTRSERTSRDVQLPPIVVPLNNMKISGKVIGTDVAGEITINGKLTIYMDLDFAIDVHPLFGLQMVRSVLKPRILAEVTVSTTGVSIEQDILQSPEINWYIPDTPIAGTIQFKLTVRSEISIDGGGLAFDVNFERSCSVGGQWDKNVGFTLINSSALLKSDIKNFRITKFNSGNLEITFNQVSAFIKLWGLVGPEFKLSGPLMWDVTRENSPSGFRYINYFSMKFEAVLKFEISNLYSIEKTFSEFEFDKKLIGNVFYPDNSSISVGVR